jgi:hypothetical protein
MRTTYPKMSIHEQIMVILVAMACHGIAVAQDSTTQRYPPGSEVGGIPVGVSGSGVYYIPDGGSAVENQGVAYNDQTGQTIPCSGKTRGDCLKMLDDATKPKTNTPPTNTTTTTTDGTPPTTSGKPPSDGTTPGDGSTPPASEDKPRKGKNRDKTDSQRRAH